ncbi:MAG TPA: ATP-binding cassette domain-containing protein, partial [Xanthobacteraceae bacterium]|nr:ATP-binding cassette domain-containing protein [Xanthobacteraceae bacterium]
PLKLRKVAPAAIAAKVDEMIRLMELKPEYLKRFPRQLSGGEQQRVALARAWGREPEILFLDEPTASLDPAATRAVEDIVGEISAQGVKIVMATHDLGQARRLAGDVAFLHKGELLEHTPAEEFFDAPRTPQAAAFLRGELLT